MAMTLQDIQRKLGIGFAAAQRVRAALSPSAGEAQGSSAVPTSSDAENKSPSPDSASAAPSVESLRQRLLTLGRQLSGRASLILRKHQLSEEEQQQVNRLCEWAREAFAIADALPVDHERSLVARIRELEKELESRVDEGQPQASQPTGSTASYNEVASASIQDLYDATTVLLAALTFTHCTEDLVKPELNDAVVRTIVARNRVRGFGIVTHVVAGLL
jgi:hypothetical protein